MKLGAYTAVLHDKPIAEALAVLRDIGLSSAEINSGGFLPALPKVEPDMAVNIEHEDAELGQLEGLQFAAKTLLEASRAA